MNILDEEIVKQIPMGSIFKHYKGKYYKIICISRHADTLEYHVVYQALYECSKFGDCPIWVRPLKIFLETVEMEGKKIPRFMLTDLPTIVDE